MRPLSEMPVAGVVGIVTDLDDTLTLDHRLVPEAYHALCDAADAGLRVVVATGRPGGYAQVLAALFPVSAVVAENGAVATLRDGGERYWDTAEERAAQRLRLDALVSSAMARFPFARLAEDMPLRRVDVAFDVGERQHLDAGEISALRDHILASGARALVSSVHAHAYFGDHDKAAMVARIAAELWRDDAEAVRERYVFIGDSPNDQAGFSFFTHSVGVDNVKTYLDRLAPPPAFVTDGRGGHGFAELVRRVLSGRP